MQEQKEANVKETHRSPCVVEKDEFQSFQHGPMCVIFDAYMQKRATTRKTRKQENKKSRKI